MTNAILTGKTASATRQAIRDTLGLEARKNMERVLSDLDGIDILISEREAGLALSAISGLVQEITLSCHACKTEIRRDESFILQYSDGSLIMHPGTRYCQTCADRWTGGGILYENLHRPAGVEI
jgi:hypothetical protein